MILLMNLNETGWFSILEMFKSSSKNGDTFSIAIMYFLSLKGYAVSSKVRWSISYVEKRLPPTRTNYMNIVNEHWLS